MLNVAKDTIKSIAIGEIELTKKDNSWRMANLADGENVKESEIESLVDKISSIPVDGIITGQDV